MNKKLLSVLLAIVMVIGMIPVTALPVFAGTTEFKGVSVDYGSAEAKNVGEDLVLIYKDSASTSALSLGGDVTADILVVGGGGSGGTVRSSSQTSHSGGGGGGAGEFIKKENITLASGTYTVSVGAGGQPKGSSETAATGENGKNSTITFGDTTLVTAAGGGGGGGESVGADGASGGGGSYKSTTVYTGGAGAEGKGNAGGDATKRNAGGGGGAGAAGENATDTVCGAGGAGVKSDITGEEKFYAAGGGGGTTNTSYSGGSGGNGGGGNGGGAKDEDAAAPTPGQANTGSGGGGGGRYKGGAAGGSGVVIIRLTGVAATEHTHGTGDDAITFEKAIKTVADLQNLFESGGSGYLAEDITLTETGNLIVKEDVDLCLNGKMLDLNKKSNISVNGAKKFNLYDCGTTQRKWDVDATGLWVPAAPESTTTNTTTGGVITGGSADNGGGVHVLGPFTMNGGNIVGNTATSGGGIYIMSSGSAMIICGNIVGNTASNGGGIWMDSYDRLIMLGGTVTCNTATEQGGGLYYAGSACIAKGTMITLADGTRKPVEELDTGDDIRVFDHDTGTLSHAKISDYWHYGEPKSGAFTLHFSNGIDVTAVTAHSFYEKEENRYVSLNAENAKDYVGHFFYNADAGGWETLESVTILNESVETYLVATEKHLDCITEGMLSCEDDIYTVFRNVFAFGKDMKVDEEQKTADIALAGGLWSYEDCPLFTRESFDALNLQYAKVAVGKGMISFEDIEQTAVYCSILDTGHFETDKAKTPMTSAPRLMLAAAPAKSPSITDFEGSALTFGGNAQVKDNYLKNEETETANNIYLTSETVINLATGTYAPGDNMLLYVSIEADSDVVPITGTAGEDDVKYFKSDDPAYRPAYDTEYSLINLEKLPEHTHGFTYTASNGKLTATCTEGCDKGYDTNPLTLTLTPPASLVYDGNAKAFTFADGEAAAWTGAGLELPTIVYTQQSGLYFVPIDGEPTNVGTYFAHIYAGGDGVNAYVTFTIAEPERADYSALNNIFDSIEDIILNPDDYNTLGEAWTQFEAKYRAAALIDGELAKSDANQQIIDNAAKELKEALDALLLAKAKTAATNEILNALPEDASEEIKAIVEKGIEAINNASSVKDVNEAKEKCLKEIRAATLTYEPCTHYVNKVCELYNIFIYIPVLNDIFSVVHTIIHIVYSIFKL